MPTQSLLPDVLIAHSGWAGTPVIGTIDENPTTGGGDWLDPATQTTSPTARVGFPTPTGPPSGVQTFKARLGLVDALGTSPTARIDLYEGGALKASGAAQTITSTKLLIGQVISQTFDLASTPLTTANGSQVEAQVVVTASGGKASSQRSASLDAVNWDIVTYTDPDTTPPVTTLGTPTRTTISTVPGWDATDVTITAGEPFVEYELRRVPAETSTRTEGALIETATVAATTSLTATITDDELVAAAGAEGPNTIKGWVKDTAGLWSV